MSGDIIGHLVRVVCIFVFLIGAINCLTLKHSLYRSPLALLEVDRVDWLRVTRRQFNRSGHWRIRPGFVHSCKSLPVLPGARGFYTQRHRRSPHASIVSLLLLQVYSRKLDRLPPSPVTWTSAASAYAQLSTNWLCSIPSSPITVWIF